MTTTNDATRRTRYWNWPRWRCAVCDRGDNLAGGEVFLIDGEPLHEVCAEEWFEANRNAPPSDPR